MPIAALPSYPPSTPPSTADVLERAINPPLDPEGREWRRQWTWRDALKEPAEFWRSTFDRPLYYTEQGRENLRGKAEGLSSGIAKSGALGEHLKELSAMAPRWFHFYQPKGAPIFDVDTLEAILQKGLPGTPGLTPQGKINLQKMLQEEKLKAEATTRPPSKFMQRLPPSSDFGFEPGSLSTTVNPGFSLTREAIAGVPDVKVSEMGEGATPQGTEALAKLLYPEFSRLRFNPRKLFSPETRETIERGARAGPAPPPYRATPLPSKELERLYQENLDAQNEPYEAARRLLSKLDRPASLPDLAEMNRDLGKLHDIHPQTDIGSKQMTPYHTAIGEGNLGHYLRRLATRELAKQDVKAIVQIPHGTYSEYETTLVRPDAWKHVQRAAPYEPKFNFEQTMQPTLRDMARLSKKIETTGPYHGTASEAGRGILLHLFRMMGR